MGKVYSTAMIAKEVGVPARTIKDWKKREFIQATVSRPYAKGWRLYFSEDDLYKVKAFKAFIDIGMHRKDAAKLAGYARPEVDISFILNCCEVAIKFFNH